MDEVKAKPAGKEGSEPSDVELVRAYRKGDAHAFEELHRRYVASIFRLVRRKLGDALLAEDIAQETFMKVSWAMSSASSASPSLRRTSRKIDATYRRWSSSNAWASPFR